MSKKDGVLTWFVWILIGGFMFPSVSYAVSQSPRRNISMETRLGYYVIDTSKFESSVFGRKYGIIGGVKANLELFDQRLQLGLGTGYMREHERNYYLYNIPLEASMNLRFKFSPEQVIVPYIGGGVDYSYFKQRARYEDPNGQKFTSILHNNRTGYHMNAGFQLLLNRVNPTASRRFDSKFGVNATYLTFEARYTDLKNFGSLKENKTDLSGWFYYMGLLFEF